MYDSIESVHIQLYNITHYSKKRGTHVIMQIEWYVRVGDSESSSAGNIEAVEETRDQETTESKHLNQWSNHDKWHSLNSPNR